MRSLIVLCLAVVAVAAEPKEGPYTGYHDRVGIPLAARIKEAELAAIQSESRIIGGQPAPLGAHPYLVGVVIYFPNSQISVCGSSMLSNTRAITAAHCWSDAFRQAEMFTLVFGSEHIFFGGVRVDTRDVESHPGWGGGMGYENDLAIVRFNHVPYTNIIQPISLPTGSLASNNFAGVWAQASGYGLTGNGLGVAANQVQSHVTLQVISNEVCRSFFSMFVTSKIICTSGVGSAGPIGICSSDSGGPLSIIHNNRRVLIGVVSFGAANCENGSPSGYVRVTEHLPWIQQRV